jgi:hypothetical protein
LTEKEQLATLLNSFNQLFNGKLGHYPHRKFHLQLKKDAKPFHSKPFAIPQVHLPTFKKELQRLCEIGVLEECGESEWGAPMFIIPKKDGTVQWVSNFQRLNSMLECKQYPLPNIKDVLHHHNGYTYLTKIDISMGYYTFELDEESQELCIIITPFRKYKYEHLPMGVMQSPDWFQSMMTQLLQDMEEVEVFIDDIIVFTNGFYEDHLKVVQRVLQHLEDNGFTVNPRKCKFAVQETDYLGYLFTPNGYKPEPKKVQAILHLDKPKKRHQA